MLNLNDGLYIGADGGKNGWVTAIFDHGALQLECFDNIRSLINAYPKFDAFLIDMAIGLSDNSDRERLDNLARKELRPRSSSVFPIPSRKAVYTGSEEEQKQANILVLGKSLSKQSISIIPKIRELDEFLAARPEYQERILESHPEVDFARLNGGGGILQKKGEAGFCERIRILKEFLPEFSETSLYGLRLQTRRLKCKPDDIADALCLAVTAALSAKGMCETIPSEPEKDAKGLSMKLTVPKKTARDFVKWQKVAVVTGGANGIGKCIAEEFRKKNIKVYVIDKTDGDHYIGDISQKDVLEAFAETVIRENGYIDYLVNNALPVSKGINECSYEEFQYALSVGVTAPFYLSKLFVPYFREGASIVNISSSRDRMSQPQTESYTAAKGGIAALTHALAVSLGPKVRVNSISPGWIDTGYRIYEGPDALQQPAGRVGNPMDIANMVLYLCSDKAGFITGENICIDGGMTKQMIYHDDYGWNYTPEQ